MLALPHRPKDVLKRYASAEDSILLEVRGAARRTARARLTRRTRRDPQEFSMFISAASKTHELLSLIPLDLLHDVRSLFSLVSRSGKSLDRQVRLPARTLVHVQLAGRCAVAAWCRLSGAEWLLNAAGARDAGGLPWS